MIHRNTRECEKCGEEHWGNTRLCTDCADKEARPLSQLRIDENVLHLQRIGHKPARATRSIRKD